MSSKLPARCEGCGQRARGYPPGAIRIQTAASSREYPKGAFTIPEAGRLFFGMGPAASYKAAEDGRIPTVSIGQRRRLVTADAIDRLLHPTDYPPDPSGQVRPMGREEGDQGPWASNEEAL